MEAAWFYSMIPEINLSSEEQKLPPAWAAVSLSVLYCCALLALPASAFAASSVLTGTFDGSEPKTGALPGACLTSETIGYQKVDSFQVSSSGLYTVIDAFNYIGVDIVGEIYEGSFDPDSPLTNLVTPIGVDVLEDVNLNAGTNYVLVVQHYCVNRDRVWINRQGAWAMTFLGPGESSSVAKADVPEMTGGNFTADDPTAFTQCGDSQYEETGPLQVSSDGDYSFQDFSIIFEVDDLVDVCVQVYSAPFNPGSPEANRVGLLDDEGSIELETGQDYYFVVQPFDVPTNGEFFYLLAPPAPFSITYAMSGSWFFPPTSGQGFLIDVFDTANLMFLAWFTYDLERPAGDVAAMIGDPGHRWLTALGPTVGNTAQLDINWSSGMIFDSAVPPVTSDADGSLTVEFYDCYTGLVTYDLGASGRTGEVPIERIVNDAVPLCETLTVGPGMPGPL